MKKGESRQLDRALGMSYFSIMETYTTQDIGAAYDRRSLETLETALGTTPLYESWRSSDPGQGQDVDARYHSLPVLNKDDIRHHFPFGLVPKGLDLPAALASGEVSFVRTSGTSDESLENIWNQVWWDASERASWRLNAVAGRAATGTHREAILASALSVGPRSENGPIPREGRMLGRFLFLNEFGTPAEWPAAHEKRILEEMADYQPSVLEANPSLLARLARFAWRTGAAVWAPPLIVLTYEFPSSLQLRAIRRVFPSPIASSYGSTEAGYVFMECEHGSLHQNFESCRVDFAPLTRGAGPPVGRIFTTTFGNRWFPLVRFDMGDIVRLANGPCPCGRGFGMTLSAIEGRTKSLCVAGDGTFVTHREIDDALAQVDGLEAYRLVQETPQRVRIGLIGENGDGSRVVRAAAEVVQGLFGRGVDIDAGEVRALLPERSGKFLLVRRDFTLGPERWMEQTETVHG